MNFVTCTVVINVLVCQVFQANSDRHTIVTNTFPRSVLASYIRVHPQSWYSWVSMRVEFIGCPIGEYPHPQFFPLSESFLLCDLVNMKYAILQLHVETRLELILF